MNMPTREQLEAIVKPAALEELMPGFGQCDYTYKEDGSIVTAADLAMQQRLEKELKFQWPEYEVLGEEMSEQEQDDAISSNNGYWCIDPLDGTNNYTNGFPLFAVSIALVINHRNSQKERHF